MIGAEGILPAKRNCVGCAGGVGEYVAHTMGAAPPPPAPSRTRTDIFTVWRIPDDPVLFFGAAFFGFGALVFFLGGMAVLYYDAVNSFVELVGVGAGKAERVGPVEHEPLQGLPRLLVEKYKLFQDRGHLFLIPELVAR